MAEISKEEFNGFYKEKIEPLLSDFEAERISLNKKLKPFEIIMVIALICLVVCFICCFFSEIEILRLVCAVCLIIAVLCSAYCYFVQSKFMKKLKAKVTSKVLTLYGNMYFSGQKNIITQDEIREAGLFPSFSRKTDDDIVIGIHKECNFVISETVLEHTEGSGKNRHTVTDFHGLIVKIQMKKRFSGKTVIGNNVTKGRSMGAVELESVEFMNGLKIYATDQIESRYILTTSFMEKIEGLQRLYGCKELISTAFMNGYVYLFIPTEKDFFEVPFKKTLLNPDNYYSIYQELDYILSVVEYLNLDRNLGL